MSESLAERLSRFTPDGSGLDRDMLLFAAGRASVRSGRRWKAVAAVLAASQLLMLGLLWPRTSAVPLTPPTAPIVVAPLSPAPMSEDSQSSWAMRGRLLNDQGDLPPPAALDNLVPDDPPLRASSAPTALLN